MEDWIVVFENSKGETVMESGGLRALRFRAISSADAEKKARDHIADNGLSWKVNRSFKH